MSISTRRVVEMAHWIGASVGRRTRRIGFTRTRRRRAGKTATASKARSAHDQLLTDPDQAVDFRSRHQGRCAGDCDGNFPTAPYKFSRKTGRRHPCHEGGRGNPSPVLPNTHSGDARLVLGAATRLQDIFNQFRRRDAAEPGGVPVEENRPRHPAWRAQGQYRTPTCRLGDDRGVPQGRNAKAKSEFDPRKIPQTWRWMRCATSVASVSKQFGTAGHAARIKGDPRCRRWPGAIAADRSTHVSAAMVEAAE